MKPLSTSIKVTPNTQVQKLPVKDQLRLLLGKVSNNEVAKLEASEKVSREVLREMAALSHLFDDAIEYMHIMGKRSVTIKVSNNFRPYYEEITNGQTGKGQFYNFELDEQTQYLPSTEGYFRVKISEIE